MADLFVEHRLLTTDVDPVTREPTFELAHESLISSWPRLSAWLADGRSDRRIVQHLSVAAAAWDDRGRSDADLYRGARLDAAEEACGDAPGGVNTESASVGDGCISMLQSPSASHRVRFGNAVCSYIPASSAISTIRSSARRRSSERGSSSLAAG